MAIHIGTSGWSYDHWDGVLYAPGTPPRDRLARYVEAFDTVELNASFYRWPRDATWASWRRRLPPGFVMTAKAPRGLTHAKKLYDPEVWIERMKAGWHALGDRRGVMLVQLPPGMARDDARLGYFLSRVPGWMRLAVEFRHPSWQDPAVSELLDQHAAGYVVMSGAHLPCILQATGSLAYVRMHGPDHHHLYAGSYSDDDLRWWADRVREWDGQGRDVHVFFNNDGYGHAVRNAWRLRQLLA